MKDITSTPEIPAHPEIPAVVDPNKSVDPIELAKENGRLQSKVKEYEDYRTKVDPVLETLWSDQELLAQATEKHNKRLGLTKDPIKPADTKPGETPPVPPQNTDVRRYAVQDIQAKFEQKAGIDKMTPEQQLQARGAIGQMLKNQLDMNNNKTIAQIFEEVSLDKLPWYMENAWNLLNRSNELKAAEQRGKNEAMEQYGDAGVIGSMAGSTPALDNITLTAAERKAAKSQNVSEADYLAQKKIMLSER